MKSNKRTRSKEPPVHTWMQRHSLTPVNTLDDGTYSMIRLCQMEWKDAGDAQELARHSDMVIVNSVKLKVRIHIAPTSTYWKSTNCVRLVPCVYNMGRSETTPQLMLDMYSRLGS